MTTQDVNQLLAIMKANYSYAFKAMRRSARNAVRFITLPRRRIRLLT